MNCEQEYKLTFRHSNVQSISYIEGNVQIKIDFDFF